MLAPLRRWHAARSPPSDRCEISPNVSLRA
jgi:hypothetical protein